MADSLPHLYEAFSTPMPLATEVARGALCLTAGGALISDGSEWTYLEAGSGISLRDVPYPLLGRVAQPESPQLELGNVGPDQLAEMLGQGLASLLQGVEVSVKGSCVTLTSPPAQTLSVSVSATPDEPPLIQVEMTPRAPGEAWGDYARRIGVGPPGADRDAWLARLRARAGE